jgi:hypothetical protein
MSRYKSLERWETADPLAVRMQSFSNIEEPMAHP